MQEVYLDLYFMVNLGMDLICLLITAAVLHRKRSMPRLWLAAALGGLYACFALLFGLSGAVGLLTDAFAAFGMCAVAFGERRHGAWRLAAESGAQLLISAFLGGMMTILFSFLNRLELPLDSAESDGASVWIFAMLAAISGLFTAHGGRLLGRARGSKEVRVEAILLGTAVELRAMVDTGNLLRDPVSGRSVIVADRRVLEPLLPAALFREDYPTAPSLAARLRVIPVKTATGNGLLRAIVPDALTVIEGETRDSCDHLIAWAELGDRAQGFDALFPHS